MKTNINEELNYIKFLFDYKKGVVISEQEVVTTTTTEFPNGPEKKIDEPKKEEEDPKKLIDTLTKDICANNNNKCKPCGEMLKLLETGNLKERTIESCLDCKSKKGSDYLNCDKIKGQLLAMSGKLNTEKSTVSGKTSIWVMLGSSLLSLGKEIKSLFEKEPPRL
jgi:hypothetical protein